MSLHPSLFYVTDASGNVQSVQIPYELWQKMEPLVQKVLAASLPESAETPVQEPLSDFADFLRFWDFHYTYDPAVSCPHCGASTKNWQEDPEHPFWLTNASLGGLLVFHCRKCGTTIRQKHFKDHVAFEFSTPVK